MRKLTKTRRKLFTIRGDFVGYRKARGRRKSRIRKGTCDLRKGVSMVKACEAHGQSIPLMVHLREEEMPKKDGPRRHRHSRNSNSKGQRTLAIIVFLLPVPTTHRECIMLQDSLRHQV